MKPTRVDERGQRKLSESLAWILGKSLANGPPKVLIKSQRSESSRVCLPPPSSPFRGALPDACLAEGQVPGSVLLREVC